MKNRNEKHTHVGRFAALCVLVLAVTLCVGGCGGRSEFVYDDGISEDQTYDTGLFYRNDLTLTHAADPSAVWVSEEEHEDGGYFYVYPTSLYHNYTIARTNDFNTWETLGPAIDWSLGSDAAQWCVRDLWAPEVIRNPVDGKYYMYFTGAYETMAAWADYYIGVAVSDSPAGPFVYYEGQSYFGETLTKAAPTIDFNVDHAAGTYYEYRCGIPVEKQGNRFATDPKRSFLCDVNPFFDDDGTLYLYFSYGYQTMGIAQGIWGVRMLDPVTPDYNSLTRLTCPGYRSLKDLENDVVFDLEASSTLNEAPHMIKHDGLFYLTFAPNRYIYRTLYSVAVSVADSPLGAFVKLKGEHCNPTLYIEDYMDHMAGPGHHSFAFAGNEMFVFYQSLMDRETGNSNPRGIAYDRISFVDGERFGVRASDYNLKTDSGTFDVLYADGPTWSLQPLPEVLSGRRNLAPDAKVTAKNGQSDTVRYLNDGHFATHDYARDWEFYAKGKTTLTFTFDKPQSIEAVMVYNSRDYTFAFSRVDEIEFELKNGKKHVIENLRVNPEYYDELQRFTRIGGAAVARFDPITVKSITIKISKQLDTSGDAGDGLKIADVVILGQGR